MTGRIPLLFTAPFFFFLLRHTRHTLSSLYISGPCRMHWGVYGPVF